VSVDILATSPRRPPGRSRHLAAALLMLMLGLLSFTAAALPAPAAYAVGSAVAQCNGIGPDALGATTEMTCSVVVVNRIGGANEGSTTTLTRQCALGPCPPGNGTFTSSSTSIVTQINQCNGSDNDAAHPIRCDVTVTNEIDPTVPGAEPVGTATVNQCVGSGAAGIVTCAPFPANTTNATVTQCNGSANGGGGTVSCTVDPQSTVSAAAPITVNQCNGTGNPGGSQVTCGVSITTRVLAAVIPSPSATPVVSPSPSQPVSTTAAATPTAAATAAASGAGPLPGSATPVVPTPLPRSPAPAVRTSAPAERSGSGASDSRQNASAPAVPTPVPGSGTTSSSTDSQTASAGSGSQTTSTGTRTDSQVSRVPSGGVPAGGGSTAGLRDVRLLWLGGALLLAAAGLAPRRPRAARRS